jgi:diaminopimelate epimerase
VIKNTTTFIATDGLHHATISDDGLVSLKWLMWKCKGRSRLCFFFKPVSPSCSTHHEDLEIYDVKWARYDTWWFYTEEDNVNFVKQMDKTFSLRLMKRGRGWHILGLLRQLQLQWIL